MISLSIKLSFVILISLIFTKSFNSLKNKSNNYILYDNKETFKKYCN